MAGRLSLDTSSEMIEKMFFLPLIHRRAFVFHNEETLIPVRYAANDKL